jgi:perosamine synthetase
LKNGPSQVEEVQFVNWKIPLYKVYSDEEDEKSVLEVIKRGSFWAIGPEIEEFEELVAHYVGRRYGVAFNSGTSALHAILLACDLKAGDEVIVPSFTFIATANAALFVGAKPVFGDVEEETLGLSPSGVQDKITRKTRAVIPVHYGGLPCHMKELQEIAKDNNLILIEDAAESIGASIDGKKVGSFSDLAMFSFCGNKIVTTGEGGIAVTDSKEMWERLHLIRSHGRLETEPYFATTKSLDYITLGYNWRMSSITAALGVSQMKKIDRIIRMRRRNSEYMGSKLSEIRGIELQNPPKGHLHVYQMYTIRVKEGKDVRDALKEHLVKKRIMSNVYFEPVHLTSFYRRRFHYKRGELPISERLSEEVLTLPMYPTLDKEKMDYISKNISEFMSAQG